MLSGDEIYGDDVTSGLDEYLVHPPIRLSASDPDRELNALRDIVDPDEDDRCVDCGVEIDGLGPPICRDCADVDD